MLLRDGSGRSCPSPSTLFGWPEPSVLKLLGMLRAVAGLSNSRPSSPDKSVNNCKDETLSERTDNEREIDGLLSNCAPRPAM